MSLEHGVRIKNIQAGSLYGYNHGTRDRYEYKNAMFTNSLLLDFLLDNGLKVANNGSTKDIICLKFDYGVRDYDGEIKNIEKIIKDEKDEVRIVKIREIKEKIESNKNLYEKLSNEEIREIFYKDGVDVEYIYVNKKGELKSKEIIHYEMLYRSTGKAKNGSCMFICKRLFKKARNFMYMGVKFPKVNAPLVEISAYAPLIASTIVGRIEIDPRDILILKDVDSFFKTNIVSVETDEDRHLIANNISDYELKNTLFDGQAIADESILPDWINGYALLRHHMCKMAAFKGRLQLFFKDWFGEKYETAEVEDMFGNKHLVKDIKLITTDNAMKWLKFGISYEYWCKKVNENGNKFGVVKTAHQSKLGDVQKMSYQMINSLDINIMDNVTQKTRDYINLIKRDNNAFLEYLSMNKNFSNDYEALVALCEQNMDFTRSEYFRDRKYRIIRSYIENVKTGKIIQDADNLVIVGSPYAMLLHSVDEDVKNDDTFKQEDGTIQCFTQRFKDGEYLAGFRSPFNSKNNMSYMHNVYDERLFKYFDFGEQIIAVNMIHTDFQDRNNGSDQDSDSLYTTNQEDIVTYARYCYEQFHTIVNNIPKETNKYDNTLLNYAIIDNSIASSRTAIGESSNIAQLALTYSYNFDDPKYNDYVCILSVLAQVAIDSAKRRFDIDIDEELDRIKKDMNINKNQYPLFWKHIKDVKLRKDRKSFSKEKINKRLDCPMNYICKMKFEEYKSQESTLPMDYFFNKFEMNDNRVKSKKVEAMIEKFSLYVHDNISDSDEYFLLRSDFDEIIETINKIYLSKNYLGLISWLIDRAFCISIGVKRKKNTINSKIDNNKSALIATLYAVNKESLLNIFSKNA